VDFPGGVEIDLGVVGFMDGLPETLRSAEDCDDLDIRDLVDMEDMLSKALLTS